MKKYTLSFALVVAIFGSVYASNNSNIVGTAEISDINGKTNLQFSDPVRDESTTTTLEETSQLSIRTVTTSTTDYSIE